MLWVITQYGLHFDSTAEQIHKRQLQRHQGLPVSQLAPLKRRQACSSQTESVDLGVLDSIQLTCPELSFIGNWYGNPGAMYYGADQYNPSRSSAWGWDAGMDNPDHNGFVLFMNAISADIVANQAWMGCICNMENYQWYSTGSLQLSWNNQYNGN
ncbi:hypothetical protein FE257_005763 [Aspergillus nanangensis]|uniref:Uncharacterized protein n=1 Tax=Aspergillus nanangensis TaxID=2582783 RepID=A0AAD4CQI9_ASPNN|nr:hypothetical protein FE257_005763 [Aspergillus nanangensis]